MHAVMQQSDLRASIPASLSRIAASVHAIHMQAVKRSLVQTQKSPAHLQHAR
jgi:hypothetical protein